MAGVSLPADLIDVKIGGVGCGTTSSDGTSISCTLAQGPAAGTYNMVEVLSDDGRVPVNLAVSAINVPLIISTITPSTDLNAAGGDVLTISGSGFP